MKKILLLASVVLVISAAWLWDCSGNMKWAWHDGMRLEAFPDGGICLQGERGSTVELQQEGIETNTGEPIVLSEGASVRWMGITISNINSHWVIKGADKQITREQENAAGQQQQYRVYADEGVIRGVIKCEKEEYEISPHAVAWLRTCVLKLEQYLRVKNTIRDISALLAGCIIVVILLSPIRGNILSVCSLVCLPEKNTGEWKTGSTGEQPLQWREVKLSWWMKMLGARNSFVCFRTPDGQQKVAPTRIQEVRHLLWSFQYKQYEEIGKLWKSLEPTLLPVNVSLWAKVRYAWKTTRTDAAAMHVVNAPGRKSEGRDFYGIVFGCSVLLLLAAIGNLIYVGRMIVKDVSAHEQITRLLLEGEGDLRLDLLRNDDGRTEYLSIGDGSEISWSGLSVRAQRAGFIVCGKDGERIIVGNDPVAEHAPTKRGIELAIGNDGQILRQREWKYLLSEEGGFEIPSYSMELYRHVSERFHQYMWKYNLAELAYNLGWLSLALLVFWSPLRTICFSIGSILCLSAKKAEQCSCRRDPALWMKLFGARMSYIFIDAAGKKWICSSDYPGLFAYDCHREGSGIERCCSEDMLASDAPAFKKIMYAIKTTF